jgi:septum formation protein
MTVAKKIILASRSPRRQVLLRQIGLTFDVSESGVDENLDGAPDPLEHVAILSQRKATEVGHKYSDAFIIGADTIVVLDGVILGKPTDPADAVRMLLTLSGKTHKVYTGFTIIDRPSDQQITDVAVTEVTFRDITPSEIDAYIQTGSPMDKAGAYGIQDDYGAVFVEKINGCFYNVVGFPVTKFYLALEQFQRTLGLL